MRFKIDLASDIVGSKFTVFALLYCVFEGNFPSTSPQVGGGLYLEGLIFDTSLFSDNNLAKNGHKFFATKLKKYLSLQPSPLQY